MSETTLRARDLTLGYGSAIVTRNLSLALPTGRVTAILGPNGCGKSTLLKAFARLIRPVSGDITLGGTDIRRQDTRALARRIGILPQAPLAPEGITVGNLVRRGRTPWRGLLSPWTQADEAAFTEALEAVAMTALRDRQLAELSGGQRQRAWLALVLAQQTPFLLLDEPTTWLDLPHQIEVLSLMRKRNRDAGTTVVSVLHDLNLAARHSDHLVLFGHGGSLVAEGPPEEVVTAANLATAFGLRARIMPDPVSGSPLVIPL
ncbi:ABC transporter ATP-binding protein [Lutibaculum baratangense]|uniref:The iron-vibriobactin/enterobactin uptake porter n=1 Tax=Lutibaculum baratangense AMV1 TaxID=631454 RepID=V4RMT6_9HYPH|nr:ABC transporter ATP-binding protein [Lutibaculum baratangense]ESR24525.1 The iron-vibriobactin/enterobactin uptake porter [Lutibaculum baratangense AMV1]